MDLPRTLPGIHHNSNSRHRQPIQNNHARFLGIRKNGANLVGCNKCRKFLAMGFGIIIHWTFQFPKWASWRVLVLWTTFLGRIGHVWIFWQDTSRKVSRRIHAEFFYPTQVPKQKTYNTVSSITSSGMCVCCQQYLDIIRYCGRVYI